MNKSKGFIAEFKEFISRGSVMDMAVGIIIGGAFTSIVKSLVDDVIMPALSVIIGRINFSDLKYVITPEQGDVAEVAICYGNFIQNIINFLLIAFVIFCMVKVLNKFHKKEEEAPAEPPKPSDEVVLLSEIRDLLQKEK